MVLKKPTGTPRDASPSDVTGEPALPASPPSHLPPSPLPPLSVIVAGLCPCGAGGGSFVFTRVRALRLVRARSQWCPLASYGPTSSR
jgi:hypothetical protein